MSTFEKITSEERIIKLINSRSCLLYAVELGAASDEDVADTLQAIDDELAKLRRTDPNTENYISERQINAEILRSLRYVLREIKTNPEQPVIWSNPEYARDIMPYLKGYYPEAVKVEWGGFRAIAATPAAKINLLEKLDKEMKDHINRGIELQNAREQLRAAVGGTHAD